MRICYVLLSSTFGMHQYTADPANYMARAGHDVHLVTTTHAPRDRYAPNVTIHTPVGMTGTGFSPESLRLPALRRALATICNLRPNVVHLTGPHLWNVVLVRRLSAQGIPIIHTLHDLDPHLGVRFGVLIRLWNRLILSTSDHILVHGQVYQNRLFEMGVSPEQVTCTPLLFLFLSEKELDALPESIEHVEYQPWGLFFGRLEQYKGIECLLTACSMMGGEQESELRMVVAGSGDLSALWSDPVPKNTDIRNHFIEDAEAIDLFRRCGVVVLPYVDATQSAQVASAYYFHKPVIVTRTGALPEYVEEGRTGHVVEPGQPGPLSRCIAALLGDPDRLAEMGATGRAWYDEQRRNEAQTLLQMYDRIARQGAR
jgi:glycosyltransferase involved in cell wall biosynthesis